MWLVVGERYATAGRDGTVRLWSVKDMSHHKTIINGTAWVTSLVFTPKSSKLAVGSFSRTVKLYDLVNGDVRAWQAAVLFCSPRLLPVSFHYPRIQHEGYGFVGKHDRL